MTVAVDAQAPPNPLDAAPLRAGQLLIFALALSLAALDGYDAASMAFVAPVLARNWHLGKDAIGLLMASSLVGTALGSIVILPFADRLGRRRIACGALVLLTLGTLISGLTASAYVLAAARIVTGLGIGTMIGATTLIASEFSSARRRAVVVASVTTVGFPLGGILGGLGAAVFLRTADWHWVFFTGAIVGAVELTLVVAFLPETPTFILARRGADALPHLNRVLGGLGHHRFAALPPPAASGRDRASYAMLFAPVTRSRTVRLIAVMALVSMTVAFMLNWLPSIVSDAGFSAAQGSATYARAQVIGFVGGVVFGALAARCQRIGLALAAMIGIAAALVAIGLVPPSLALFIAAAGLFSFFLNGSTGLFYSIVADSFSPLLRATGIGLVLGAGRIAAAFGPAIGGILFKHGLGRAPVCAAFALLPLAASVIVAQLAPADRRSAGRRP